MTATKDKAATQQAALEGACSQFSVNYSCLGLQTTIQVFRNIYERHNSENQQENYTYTSVNVFRS